MDSTLSLFIGVIIVVVIILLIRFFGAWMFRIDEVIKNQKEIIKILKNNNDVD